MPRLKRTVPKYRLHKASGRAVVTIQGRDHYLGRHGSDESMADYDRLIARYIASGRPSASIADSVGDVTINVLATDFLQHAKRYYVKDGKATSELSEFRVVIRTVCTLFGDTLADEFGPRSLKACRQTWLDAGVTRQTINKRQGRLVRIFKWGVSEELIAVETWQKLTAVEGIRQGRTDAKEMKEVPPVDLNEVRAVIPFCSPIVQAMIRLQMFTGMRPSEVCKIRPDAIDRTGDVWEYDVAGHKTVHHGRRRIVFLGPEAQSVLAPYLLRPGDQYCFSAEESREWFRSQAESKRVTPPSCGNARGRKHGRKPKQAQQRLPRPYFNTGSYGAAISSACRKAWPVPEELANDPAQAKAWIDSHRFSPNQLRHTLASAVRKQFGLEAAQVILGHSHARVTEIYAEVDKEKARQVSRQIG